MSAINLPSCLPRPLPVLTREKAAQYLTELGYPITKGCLAKLAVSGGGPAYRHWGRRVLYRPEDLLSWIEERHNGRRINNTAQNAA